MNNQELISKVHSAMYAQCRKRAYATHFVDSRQIAKLKVSVNPNGGL